jgi:hypothetical protein
MDKSPVVCQLMPVIMKYLNKQAVCDLPLVSKDFNEAVQGCSDVFWEKLDIVKYLTWGKITPSGIPCSVKRLHWPNNVIYTFTYIPLTHGDSPIQILKSYVDFIRPVKDFEISVSILTREEHFLRTRWLNNDGESCIRFQCIYTTRMWHNFSRGFSTGIVKVLDILRRVNGLENLLLDYSDEYPPAPPQEYPLNLVWHRTNSIEGEFNSSFDIMNG